MTLLDVLMFFKLSGSKWGEVTSSHAGEDNLRPKKSVPIQQSSYWNHKMYRRDLASASAWDNLADSANALFQTCDTVVTYMCLETERSQDSLSGDSKAGKWLMVHAIEDVYDSPGENF